MTKRNKATVIGLVTLALAVGYGFKIQRAKQRALDFCALYKVGDPVAGIETSARFFSFDHVVRVRDPKPDSSQRIIAVAEGFGFLRYSCELEFKNRVITRTSSTLMN